MSTTETQAVPAGTWAVDKVHSNVGFAVDYMAGTFTGSFNDWQTVDANRKRPVSTTNYNGLNPKVATQVQSIAGQFAFELACAPIGMAEREYEALRRVIGRHRHQHVARCGEIDPGRDCLRGFLG